MDKIPQEGAFRMVFGNRHVVFPVIHVRSSDQALRNVGIAKDAGADGVFLINHATSVDTLLQVHASVTGHFPGFWVGVNCLGLQPAAVFSRVTPAVSGVWVDNAAIDELGDEQFEADAIQDDRRESGWTGLYFGGVAFKYQRRVNNLSAAARLARDYMDVVTTSGPGTGQAAHVKKIRIMKKALGRFPLGIASGITPDNVADYLPHSDCYLVATGISRTFEELDPVLVRRLVVTVQAYDRAKQ